MHVSKGQLDKHYMLEKQPCVLFNGCEGLLCIGSEATTVAT